MSAAILDAETDAMNLRHELQASPLFALPAECLSTSSAAMSDIHTVLVEVTPADIEAGRRNDGLSSPVALAMNRACAGIANPLDPDARPGLHFFVTRRSFVLIHERDGRSDVALSQALRFARQFPLPQDVQDWIGDYDQHMETAHKRPRFWLCFDRRFSAL